MSASAFAQFDLFSNWVIDCKLCVFEILSFRHQPIDVVLIEHYLLLTKTMHLDKCETNLCDMRNANRVLLSSFFFNVQRIKTGAKIAFSYLTVSLFSIWNNINLVIFARTIAIVEIFCCDNRVNWCFTFLKCVQITRKRFQIDLFHDHNEYSFV